MRNLWTQNTGIPSALNELCGVTWVLTYSRHLFCDDSALGVSVIVSFDKVDQFSKI